MDWKKEILEWLEKHNGEGVNTDKGTMFVFPKINNKARMKEEIRGILPDDHTFDIIEGPKQNSLQEISKVFSGKVGEISSKKEDKHIIFQVSTKRGGLDQLLGAMVGQNQQQQQEPLQADSEEWCRVTEILSKDGYFSSWEYVLDGKSIGMFHKILSAEHSKNMKQGQYIKKDDLLNLKIALGEANSVEEFLAAM